MGSKVRSISAAVILMIAIISPPASALDDSFEMQRVSNLGELTSKIPKSKQVKQIAVSSGGTRTACALMADGSVKCWGSNDQGQVGVGYLKSGAVKSDSHKPRTVKNLKNAIYVATNDKLSCAVVASGEVYCWGFANPNFFNRFSSPGSTRVNFAEATKIEGVSGASQVAIDRNRACAVTQNGVMCWGGDNDRDKKDAPFKPFLINGFETVTSIALGNDGPTNSGALYGIKSTGELIYKPSLSTVWDSSRPANKSFDLVSNASSFSLSYGVTCYLDGASKVLCFSANRFPLVNNKGRLGNGTVQHSATPGEVVGLPLSQKVSVGTSSVCAVTEQGELYCWGGRVANTRNNNVAKATKVNSLSKVVDVQLGDDWGCAVDSVGQVFCWGSNGEGNLGVSKSQRSSAKPIKVKF